jgi:hypothetical protein
MSRRTARAASRTKRFWQRKGSIGTTTGLSSMICRHRRASREKGSRGPKTAGSRRIVQGKPSTGSDRMARSQQAL